MSSNLRAIDLFCGAGGLSVGLKQAGFNVIAGIEIDSAAAETYKLNHKDHKLYNTDIKKLDPYAMMLELKIKPGELDLLAGCPPCQGFSSHRTRNKTSSVDDHRNDLVFEYLRFVKAFLPKTIMMENVPALAKDNRMEKVKSELSKIGYLINDNSIKIKDTSSFGVPQRRKRMILQASMLGAIPEPQKIKQTKTVRDAIGHLPNPGNSGDELHDLPYKMSERIKEMVSLIPKDGGSRSDLPMKYWLQCHIKSPSSYTDVYGRMAWHQVAPTITGGCVSPSKGRYLHPTQNRAITLREAALLQTFPKNYKFSLMKGKDSVALMIGNALPPKFIKIHALEIKKHLLSKKDR